MSVKLYTPDSNVIVHQAKVDFRRRVVQRQVNLVQYDKSMPIIAVQLYSNGTEYVLPETANAYIRFGKRDHTYVYNECLGCDQTRTIVYFAITDQMTIFYGEHTPIIELRIGDTVAGSGSIPIWIDRNPIQNGDTESKSDLSVFEKAIEAAQKINVKLPTDLGASATNLHLLAGATKLGGGINLSGFEYDEATKTLKASGGGGVIETITATKTSDPATEEEGFTALKLAKAPTGNQFILSYIDYAADNDYFILMTKIEDGSYMGASFDSLYGSLLSYAFIDVANDENLLCEFKSFDVSFLDEAANAEKNAGKVLVVEKQGGIGLSDIEASAMTEKFVTLVEENAAEDCPLIQKYHGIYGLYNILDGRAGAIKIDGSRSNYAIFIGYPFWYKNDVHDGYLIGSIYMGMGAAQRSSLNSEFDYAFVGTGVYEFFNGKINITPKGCVGNMTLSGLALLAGHKTASDEITTAIQNGVESRPRYKVNLMALQYGFKETADGSAVIKTFLGYVDHKTSRTSNKIKLSGLFDGKQGTAILEKDASGAWTSNTPIEYVEDVNAITYSKARYKHTVTLKTSAGAILWTQTLSSSKDTVVNSYANLKTLFGEATYAGFGEYCQLNLEGGTEVTDKLIKADGTEVTLASLGAIVYTDKCFLPK